MIIETYYEPVYLAYNEDRKGEHIQNIQNEMIFRNSSCVPVTKGKSVGGTGRRAGQFYVSRWLVD